MTPAPILVPGETEPRFVWGDAEHIAERVVTSPRPDLGPWRGPTTEVYTRVEAMRADRREYYLASVGRVVVFCTDEDAPRLLAALRLAVFAILIAWWLGEMLRRPNPYAHVNDYLAERRVWRDDAGCHLGVRPT